MHEPIIQGRIASLRVGKPQDFGVKGSDDPLEAPWNSAISRAEVSGPIFIGPEGFEGDQVGNKKYHGGPDKAICAYSLAHYADWAVDLPHLNLGPGAFGENLTIDGLAESDVCIGDVWELVSTASRPGIPAEERPHLQVSQPRQPCFTLVRRWKERALPKITIKTGRTGWYFRVDRSGIVSSGDRLELIQRPHPDWSVERVNQVTYAKSNDLSELLALPPLSAAWKADLV